MNKEIKEILDRLKEVKEPEMYITPKTCKKLINYITNLQEKIDKATKYIRSNEWAKDYENSSCRTHLLNILQGEDKNE